VNSIGHVDDLHDALNWLCLQSATLDSWGCRLARTLKAGGRLLVAGNGGSAAEAQHLTAELVGRFEGDRAPFSAIALHADTSAMTAIGNDYGYDDVFARQVTAHARPGDIVMLLSTSGRSPNVLKAAAAARRAEAVCWAMTGRAPNPLASIVDEALCVPAEPPTVQEAHLVAVHVLCGTFENALLERRAS
jgi:D-sedoheptulose 7-phosphate isomerase